MRTLFEGPGELPHVYQIPSFPLSIAPTAAGSSTRTVQLLLDQSKGKVTFAHYASFSRSAERGKPCFFHAQLPTDWEFVARQDVVCSGIFCLAVFDRCQAIFEYQRKPGTDPSMTMKVRPRRQTNKAHRLLRLAVRHPKGGRQAVLQAFEPEWQSIGKV